MSILLYSVKFTSTMAVNRNNLHIQILNSEELAKKILTTEYKELYDIIKRFGITGNDLLVLQEFELKIKYKNGLSKKQFELLQSLVYKTQTTPDKLFSVGILKHASFKKPSISAKPMLLPRQGSLRLKNAFPKENQTMAQELETKLAQRKLSMINNEPANEQYTNPIVLNEASIDKFNDISGKQELEQTFPKLKENIEMFLDTFVSKERKDKQIDKDITSKSASMLLITTKDNDSTNCKDTDLTTDIPEENNALTRKPDVADIYDIPKITKLEDSNSSTSTNISTDTETNLSENQDIESYKQNDIQLTNKLTENEKHPESQTSPNKDYDKIVKSTNTNVANHNSENKEKSIHVPPPLPPRNLKPNLKINKRVITKKEPSQQNSSSKIESKNEKIVIANTEKKKTAPKVELYSVLPNLTINPPEIIPDEGNIYEEPINLTSPKYIFQLNKFYRNVSRVEGLNILQNRPTGTFLFRPSTKPTYIGVLMLKGGMKIQNVPVSYYSDQERYCLVSANKDSKAMFANLNDLIQYYTKKDINGDYLIQIENNVL